MRSFPRAVEKSKALAVFRRPGGTEVDFDERTRKRGKVSAVASHKASSRAVVLRFSAAAMDEALDAC
jgi:hypothetical protein